MKIHRRFPSVIPARMGLKTLSLCAVVWLSLAMSTQAALIGYWNFDEASGTTASDTSGRVGPLNGTLSASGAGAVVPARIAGRFGNALDFNQGTAISAGGLVTVPYNADLRLAGAFTISFWWRPDYVPAASTFPGIMRIGSQSPVVPAANSGWGYFRSQPNIPVHKRNNHQPTTYTALTVGAWHHIALTHDGAGNNIAFQNGAMINFTTNWPTPTTTAVFEMGRMDAFDNAGLDDVGLFNETISLAKTRSLYTVPNSLSLTYDLAKMRQLWALFDAGPGSSGMVDGTLWEHTATLPGSTTLGDAYISGSKWYVVLGSGVGMRATATLLGDISPAGVGVLGTQAFTETPTIGGTARFVFDLGSTTTIGGGANDLYEITGDLNVSGNTVVINPLAPLATGTYRLINYSGTKSGSFNAVVVSNSRYTLALDQATAGQINLVVSGSNGDVKWTSPSSGAWDVTSLNWQNTFTVATDRFFQGDSVRFDDSGAFQPTINLATGVFPSAMTVDSSTLNYAFAGSPLGGLGNGLTKNGTSVLTLSGANTFIGPVTVNNGLLRIGNGASLGSTNSGTTIASGATLDLNNQTPANETVTVAGSGLGGIGAIVNNNAGGNAADALRTVTLSGDATFGGTGRWDLTGKINGGGNKLTKVGANEIWIAPVSGDTGLGDIEIQTGALGFEGSAIPALGLPGSILTIQSAGTLGFWALNNAATPMQKTVVMNGGTWRNDNGNNHFNGGVTLNGNSIMTVGAGATLNQLGVIDGGGSLIKNNPGTLVLAGVNTYTGATMVNAGTLGLLNSGSIAGSSGITLASGTILNAATRSDGTLTLAPGQTLSGSGTNQGNVAAGTGTGISPGFSAGTLTVTNALSLTDATLTYELSGATTEGGGVNDLINVGGALTLGGSTTVKILPVGTLALGTPYTLINYVGALTGGPLNLNPVSDSRHTFVADTLTTPGKVLLNVLGAAQELEWTGGGTPAPAAWDLKTSDNWLGLGVEQFYAGDTVVFNDLALEYSVSLVGDLYPAQTRMEADVEDYIFTGSGRIRGGGLSKSFGGKLTLANSGVNDYPGQTIINGGTLQVGNGGTVGNLGPNSVVNNGTLAISRSDNQTFANTMTGTGTLRKEGGNVLTVGASLAGFNGTLAVVGGTLRPTVATGLGTAIGGVVVSGGGTFDLNALNYGAEPVTVQGAGVGGAGAIVNASATAQTQPLSFVTLSGDATFGGVGRWDVRNPGTGGSLTGNGFTLTKVGANQVSLVGLGDTGLGDVNVQQGIFSAETTTGLGLPSGTVSVQSGATLMLWGNTVTQDKKFALNGGARLFKDNGAATIIGTGTLTGSNAVEVASNAGGDLTLGGVISGLGSLNKLGAGTNYLTADNNYGGGTLVSAGALSLGNGGTAGNVLGNIVNNAALFVRRSDGVILNGNVTGTGTLGVRSAPVGMTVPSGVSVLLNGSIQVGQDNPGKMIVENGAVVSTGGQLLLGNPANVPGEVTQTGGDVWVALETRIGHWPGNVSTYIMGGGTLNLTNVPTGTAAERNGILYIGVDGTGIFTQTGGVARAHGIVLDNRGETPGVDTMNLQGGRFIVGPSGIGRGNPTNTSYLINLGGGTIASSANWTSVLNMTLTGTGGDTTIDSDVFTNVLTGAIGGTGSLVKKGAGGLVLSGVCNYDGLTDVNQGRLVVLGSLGLGLGGVTVQSGATLMGTGSIIDAVDILPGGTLAPGLSIGTLTAAGDLTLGGSTVMEINKTGAVLTSDKVVVGGTLTVGGTLMVVASGDALAAGDTFDLADFSSVAGTGFTGVTLPVLASGLSWDLTQLPVNGTIRVALRPTIATPSLSGTMLTLSGSGGTPGAAYRVFCTLNVTAPVSSWTQVATGNFDGSGNFSVVITINPADPQRFYYVVTP